MARIIVWAYAVRCPFGGYLSLAIQWLVGFQQLGHEVYFVEKCGWSKSCYDPSTDQMGDDCSYGVAALTSLLTPFDLDRSWCFVDNADQHHGLNRMQVQALFDEADLFVDMGTHGTWLEEAGRTGLRVLVDNDPVYTQMRAINRSDDLEGYDHYYSVGQNVGTDRSTVPTLGKAWRPVYNPVVTSLCDHRPADGQAPVSTIMAWQSYPPLDFKGRKYGQKDVEFAKFIDLPARTSVPLEVAVGGELDPSVALARAGWRVQDPLVVTASAHTYRDYIAASRGEFTVCKNVYVATNSEFFSDRSAVYLASARPVVMQDTGLDCHLPSGAGFFAVRNVAEAAAALEAIEASYDRHSEWACELAHENLSTRQVLGTLLSDLGV